MSETIFTFDKLSAKIDGARKSINSLLWRHVWNQFDIAEGNIHDLMNSYERITSIEVNNIMIM